MMKKYGVNELRQMFLDFMESKGHLVHKSYSLVPQGDKSLLLINAGMTPLKPYFTGAEIPPRKRMATCQKCIRTGDIENVGKTARHGTFFEMLGNFSFGDYLRRKRSPGHGNSLQRQWDLILTDCILLFIWTTTRPLIFGIKTSESRRKESSVLEKRIISGSTGRVPAVPALRFIMTGVKNTAAANRDVR